MTEHTRPSGRQLAIGGLWLVALTQVVTLHDTAQFVLFEPWSGAHRALIAAFVATSLAIWRTRSKVAASAHILVVLVLLIRHPTAAVLGRDGFIALFSVYLVAVVHVVSASCC